MTNKLIATIALCLSGLNATAQTTPAGHMTQPLDPQLWEKSEWISVVNAPIARGRMNDGARAADGANWFVARQKNRQKVVAARWMTTGLGVYQLYVNGKAIGQEVLKPGFTNCFKTKRSFTYDVTKAMKCKGGEENVLSVQVTPGWWADKIITPGGSNGMYGTKCAFRGVLCLTYADGTTEHLGTDTVHWQAGMAGPVKHAAIYDGEEYDARLPMAHEDMAPLASPEVNREFRGEILPSEGAEVYHRHDLALTPRMAYVWKDTEGKTDKEHGRVVILRQYPKGRDMTLRKGETLVIDFGQNCSAVPRFVFTAREGTRLTCLPGELLNDGNGAHSRGMDGPEGSVHRLNLRTHETHMRLDYTFADNGSRAVTYTPQCTFFGYRYLSLTATDEVTLHSVHSIPVSSLTADMETGTLTTGHPLINQLISNTWWGQLSNYLSVPTDCPQRNERLGWTADTQVFAETGTFFADTRRFFHKWLRDLRDTQSVHGGYPSVAPHGQYASWDGEMMRFGWSDAGIIVPWTVWKQYGDTDIIHESWDSMQRYMTHMQQTKYDHATLSRENGNYQWGDWLSYEPLESCGGGAFGQNGPLPEAIDYWNYLSSCYWVIDAEMMADMARATGRDPQPYVDMAEEARGRIRSLYLQPDGTFRTAVLNTMQTPALFALRTKVVEGEGKQNVIARLRRNFADHGNCLQTGFLGTSILMSTLTADGMSDIAYSLLFQRKNPSWLYSVDNGATTIWERWNSYTLEHGMGPRGMNSFNHYAYGCVCQWLWETAAGICADPSAPGFRHILMSPIPDRRLGYLKASYRSAAGLIKSEWAYRGDKWTWTFVIPKGCTATVTVPGEEPREYGEGRHRVSKSLAQ